LSPITQRIASMMFDLPQPFGPTTPVMLVGKCRVVGSTNDLKPASLIVVRRMQRFSSGIFAPRDRARRRASTGVARTGFVRRARIDRKRVDVGFHHAAERGIHGAMAGQRQLPAEHLGDHAHAEMPAPIARAGMADMAMALVLDLEFG